MKKNKTNKTTERVENEQRFSWARFGWRAIMLIILVIVTVILVVMVVRQKLNDVPQYWIDCQPPLSEVEAERCEKARDANYPYIAY